METKVNSQVKILVRSVLISGPKQMHLNEFLNLYKFLVGKPLPYIQLGFASAVDLLYSMPDVVQITEESNYYTIRVIFDEKTKHLEKLVLNQRRPDAVQKKKNNDPYLPPNALFAITFINAELKAEIIHVIAHFEGNIQFNLLPLAYEKILKKPLILKDGLISLAKIIFPIKQLNLMYSDKIVRIRDTEYDPNEILSCRSMNNEFQNNERYYDRSNNILSCNQSFDKSGVSKMVQNIFKKVMKMYPNGILAVEFPSACEAIATGSFDLHAFGYVSLSDLINALPAIFRCETISESKKDYLILPSEDLLLFKTTFQ